MKFRVFGVFFMILLPFSAMPQTGGNNTFEFLNLAAPARIAALGGNLISVIDNDLNLAFQNPAVLNEQMNKTVTFNYVPYLASVKFGYAAYGFNVPKAGMLSAGIHYVDYGDFDWTDDTGNKLGTFSAAEYSFNLSWAKKLFEGIQTGVTLKTIYSKLESYTSTGVAADLGLHYQSPSGHFSAGGVIRNAGRQLKSYTDGNREPLPVEIQAGVSYLLPKAPFRLSMTVHNLEKWNLGYINPNEQGKVDLLTGDTSVLKISLFEKITRHLTPSVEVLITKNFNLRLAYNLMRRRDLLYESHRSMAGLSFGIGFRVSKFVLSYGLASYNSAGSSSHFSISTNLGHYQKKEAGEKSND